MKINKKNQTKLAAKEKNDKIKIVNRISSPSFKSPLPNELKHWKSEK